MCACMCVCVCVCLHAHACMRACLCVYVCLTVCLHVHARVCMHVCWHVGSLIYASREHHRFSIYPSPPSRFSALCNMANSDFESGNELVFITVRAPSGSANSISHNSMQSAISPTWILDYRARAFIYLSFLPSAYSSSLRFSSDISIFLSPCVLCIALYANPPWNVYQVISSGCIGCDDNFLNKVLPNAVLYDSSKIQRNRS